MEEDNEEPNVRNGGNKWRNNKYHNKYYSLIHSHPYLTYHVVPPTQYRRYFNEITISPYSIPLFAYENENGSRDASSFRESDVKDGFCAYIGSHEASEIAAFMNWQFKSYLEKPGPKENHNPWLYYLIFAIETYREWSKADFLKLTIIAQWMRSTPRFFEGFEYRFKTWGDLDFSFQEAKEEQENPKIEPALIEPSTLIDFEALKKSSRTIQALYYRYLQEAKYEEYFENLIIPKKEAIAEIVAKYGGVSAKHFEQKYNEISILKNRISSKHHKNIKKVIPLLSNYPLALELALKELKESEFK